MVISAKEGYLHSMPFQKSIIIERTTIQYVKDRTECFDDSCFPCTKKVQEHIMHDLICLFVDMHNG